VIVAQVEPASRLLKIDPVLLPNEAYTTVGFWGSTATVAALVKGKMPVHVAPPSVLLKIPAVLEAA
jgi:hypothetical protein